MYFDELDVFLRQNTPQEVWHLDNPGKASEKYNTIGYEYINNEKVYIFDFSEDLINDFVVIKETRYTELLKHKHKYIELNYVYSGKCKYYVNDLEIELVKGDIGLFEQDVIHSAREKGEDDIVINIAMKEELYRSLFVNYTNSTNNIMYDFLFDCMNKNCKRNRFLVLKNCNIFIDLIINSIVCMYFSNRQANFDIITKEYFKILFLHLTTQMFDENLSNFEKKENDIILKILNLIQTKYNIITLNQLSRDSGYNYAYLSNLIVKKTGKKFSEIKLLRQLDVAEDLLSNSDYPICKISEMCGFTNLNFFYKKFKQKNNITPAEWRKKLDLY